MQKSLGSEEILYGESGLLWRAQGRDRLAFIAAVDTEIILIHSDDDMARIEFAHANQTQIGEIGFAIFESAG